MLPALRVCVAILFWAVQLWWCGHIVQALRYAGGGSFRIYSVLNNEIRHNAWGLTFTGGPGQALAIVYLVLVVSALIGLVVARKMLWILAAVILLAWAALFAANSLWLLQWKNVEWWDWINYAGFAIVVTQIMLTWRWR